MVSVTTSRALLAAAAIATLVALLPAAHADIYLHNMRGSNNRLDERNRDRNNANRLFDSQNNNRGGYNVGSLYFYEGERMSLSWTNQHSCGSDYNDCQIVFQYMCDDRLRDGVTTRTIPDQPSNCQNKDCNHDVRYGMHEDFDYYMNCKYRFRNRGLFTADRNLNGNTARYTRQNNNGQRRGYECPEERLVWVFFFPCVCVFLPMCSNPPLSPTATTTRTGTRPRGLTCTSSPTTPSAASTTRRTLRTSWVATFAPSRTSGTTT